jgi:hypothetical protein
LSGKGGLVWIKPPASADAHAFYDTVRTRAKTISTCHGTGLSSEFDVGAGGDVASFNTDGYTMGNSSTFHVNDSGLKIGAWTFRMNANFFDIVTYTGNGVAGRTVNHALTSAPGMIMIKRRNAAAVTGWAVWHRSATGDLWLNATSIQNSSYVQIQSANATTFTLGSGVDVNANGGTYVAYLFGHSASADGLINCGTFVSDASGNSTGVTLPWEPQFIMMKSIDKATDWIMVDSVRGLPVQGNVRSLFANLYAAENSTVEHIKVNPTGFTASGGGLAVSGNYIYVAIRRPHKSPTLGTQVYNAIARTGTAAAAQITGVGFAPSLCISAERVIGGYQKIWRDNLRGLNALFESNASSVENLDTPSISSFDADGVSVTADNVGSYCNTINASGKSYINWFFKRAPGVFEMVNFIGDLNSNRNIVHNLSAVPELLICKARTSGGGRPGWYVSGSVLAANSYLLLNTTDAYNPSPYYTYFFGTGTHTSTTFMVGNGSENNQTGEKYIAYLFASKVGISKIGSFIGNGSSQTINCSFTTGSRFIMIKRTDAVGDWYVWDSVRGLNASTEPHSSMNTATNETSTDDSIDSTSTGFIVKQNAATNVNVSSANYIFLSFA